MESGSHLQRSLADLRRDFDDSFALPPRPVSEQPDSFLIVRAGGEEFAARAAHIAAVVKRRSIMPIPARVPCLLGLTTIRGTLLPVYDAAMLLGLRGSGGEGSWFIEVGRETPVALLFDEFAGRVELARSDLYESDGSGARKHLRVTARIGARHRAVIDIAGLLDEIRERAGWTASPGSNTK